MKTTLDRLRAKIEVWVDTLCLLAQPKKDNNKFKNKKQPELAENQTVWNSDNQRVKEETFIQNSRRGGDGQPGGENSRKAETGGPGQAAAGRVGGPTIACR